MMSKMKKFSEFIAEASEFVKHGKCLTKGEHNNCYENARKEYHAQKAIGKKPKYHVGSVIGHHIDSDPDKHPVDVPHAWVTVDNKVHDSTPFKHGHGNYKDLPSKPANEYWKSGTKYRSSYEVHHDKLHTELKTFPRKD